VAVIGSDRMTTAAARIGVLERHVRSPSTRRAALVGLLCYVGYAWAHGSWANVALIGASLLVGVAAPGCAKLGNKAELWGTARFGFVTAGNLGRLLPHLGFSLALFWAMASGGALNPVGLASVGGIAGAALVATLATLGAQTLGLLLFRRGIGTADRNVLLGTSASLLLAAFGTADMPYAREAFLSAGAVLGTLFLGVGLLSDIRSMVAPRGGIGLFFGTFNPFHNTHLEIVKRAIAERQLDKVVVHPTLVPRIHADAFAKGELRVARLQAGFQIYETTNKADVNVDYFPSGRMFLPPETRKALIELALAEAGFSDKVEVAFLPETYNASGFHGVIAEIRKRHPRTRLHGLHGTDLGGMTVRGIYDDCGWIYPWRILRRDQVSATAIRKGARGMTAEVVTDVLAQLAANHPVVAAGGRRFRNDNGALSELP